MAGNPRHCVHSKLIPKVSFTTDFFPSAVDQDVQNTGMKEVVKDSIYT